MSTKVVLRRFRQSDIGLIAKWARQKEVWEAAVIGAYQPIQPEDPRVKDWFTRNLLTNEHAFVVERTPEATPIGTVGFKWLGRSEAEMEITIGEIQEWGKGYAREALCMLLKHGFEEMKLGRILGKVLRTNVRALAFYRKAGFTIGDDQGSLIAVSMNRADYEANQLRVRPSTRESR